jgi:hypothetical protein
MNGVEHLRISSGRERGIHAASTPKAWLSTEIPKLRAVGEVKRQACRAPRLLQVGAVALASGFLFLAGCTISHRNPASPRANTGYVDFYTDMDLDLYWQIKEMDKAIGKFKIVFREFKSVDGNILRLPTAPGSHEFQVWMMNCVTDGPKTIRVQVEDGKVTPVHIALQPLGAISIDRKEYGFRGSTKGYGRGTKIITDENEVYRIGPTAGTPEPYRPSEKMPYVAAAAPAR